VRRSEAMLSHLVATSPDLITLTDLSTGRYVMVNRAFERVTGFRAADAVGRTALELGVWGRPEQRQRFVTQLAGVGLGEADLPVTVLSKPAAAWPCASRRRASDGQAATTWSSMHATSTERARWSARPS
jgi:PAS domain-containing protein